MAKKKNEIEDTTEFDEAPVEEIEQPQAEVFTASEVKESYEQQIKKIKSKLNALEFEQNKEQILEGLPDWQKSVEGAIHSQQQVVKLHQAKFAEIIAELQRIDNKKK